MPGITERNKMKDELISLGYSMRYIDEWQPKTRLYRHKAAYNVDGAMMEGVGTFVDNVPGSPDYVSRKARLGLLQWPPSDSCTCRWCGGSKGAEKPESAKGKRFKKVGPYHRDS
tara:strand:- start:89 stop:430 length:342 start_codon:yes stop_codon:yes gene_type:complete